MKKIFQFSSILILAAAIFTLSAHAQTGSRIDAKIPFNFNIGDQSYDAGNYVIKTEQVSDSTQRVSLLDSDGRSLHTFLAYSNGEVAKDGDHLVFDIRDNNRYLAKILTKDDGILLQQAEPRKVQIARRF